MTDDSGAIATNASPPKRTSALLRDARSVQRRLDTLGATAMACDDPSLPRIAEARDAVQRLVIELTYRELAEKRRSKQSGRQRY